MSGTSLKITPVAAPFPLLTMVTTYSSVSPGEGTPSKSASVKSVSRFWAARLGSGTIVTPSMSSLLPESGSGTSLSARTVFEIVPLASLATVTIMSKVAKPPARIAPNSHTTTPGVTSLHPSVSLTKVSSAGSVSVTTTPTASDGPALVMMNV